MRNETNYTKSVAWMFFFLCYTTIRSTSCGRPEVRSPKVIRNVCSGENVEKQEKS